MAAISCGAGAGTANASALVVTNVTGLGNFLVVDSITGKRTLGELIPRRWRP